MTFITLDGRVTVGARQHLNPESLGRTYRRATARLITCAEALRRQVVVRLVWAPGPGLGVLGSSSLIGGSGLRVDKAWMSQATAWTSQGQHAAESVPTRKYVEARVAPDLPTLIHPLTTLRRAGPAAG